VGGIVVAVEAEIVDVTGGAVIGGADVVIGTQETKIRAISQTVKMFLIFINYLVLQTAAQRLALAAWGGSVDSLPKREKFQAGKMPK
jgi:hypothetical protein